MPRTTTKTPAQLDLHKLLLAELAQKGVKVKARWAPSRNYASLLVGKTNIGYVFQQTRHGIRVEPAASKGDLPKTVKGFKPGTRSERFALVGVFTDEPGVKQAATALAVAAKKAAPSDPKENGRGA